MENFSKAFLRLDQGVWLCRDVATIEAGDGRKVRATPGVTYRLGKLQDGVDVAAWLDAYHADRALPAGGWRSVTSHS